jgi:dienelactone hydrolase
MEEDRPEYNCEAAELAWRRTIEFLKSDLKGR